MRCPRLSELPPPPEGKSGWPWTEGHADLPDTMAGGSAWPRVAIVTASYNQGKFLEQTIRSVLLQGYPDLEYIIVDGGSNDESIGIIRKYEEWLAYWCSETDGGPPAALNKGFRHTTGDVLGYLNADDFYLRGCLPRIADEFQRQPLVDVVYGNGHFTYASTEVLKPIFSDQWDLRRFAYGACIIIQQATFFRKKPFQNLSGFNEDNRTCWDAELLVELALAGAQFNYCDDFLGVFRIHEDSITASGRFKEQLRRDQEWIFEKIIGRSRSVIDRLFELIYRIQRFSSHPYRALDYRLFFRRALKRWWL